MLVRIELVKLNLEKNNKQIKTKVIFDEVDYRYKKSMLFAKDLCYIR